MYNKNAAFDVIPSKHERYGQIIKLPKTLDRKAEKRKSIRAMICSGFSTFLVAAIGVSVYIFGQAQLTEYTDKVCKASKQLEECQSENIALSMKYKTPESFGEGSAAYAGDNASVEIIRVSSEDAALVK